MSFRFLNLTLRDWLVYEGSISVRFTPVHESHNIWVVYGLNGYGKTSLLRAIQWLFHDAMPDRYIRDCFNANALRAGRNELSVSAEFTYNGRHYHLIRRAVAQVQTGQGGRLSQDQRRAGRRPAGRNRGHCRQDRPDPAQGMPTVFLFRRARD